MAIGTIQLTFIMVLVVAVGVSVWWYIVAEKYRNYLLTFEYARGANIVGAGKTVRMTCDADREICVYRANQICSIPDGNNFESSGLEPFASGTSTTNKAKYGAFDPATTVDLTPDLTAKANGKTSYDYVFKPVPYPGSATCKPEGNQLISTYTCIPKGAKCVAHKSTPAI